MVVRPKKFPRILAFVFSILAGCVHSAATKTPGLTEVFKTAPNKDQSPDRYIIEPPDSIKITSKGIREIDALNVTVQPDGQIDLRSFGKLKIGGLTPRQAEDAVAQAVAATHPRADVQLHVIAKSKFITVLGPGGSLKVAYTGADSVVFVLAEAGFTEHNFPSQVVIIRQKKGPRPTARVLIDIRKMFETGDDSQNYQLDEDDMLRVSGEEIIKLWMGSNFGPPQRQVEAGPFERIQSGTKP